MATNSVPNVVGTPACSRKRWPRFHMNTTNATVLSTMR